MIDFYLVTGFLGAGKTTFLKRLITAFQGQSLRLIINEFGRASVDGALLESLSDVEEITDGSIFCTCRIDRFEAALKTSVEANPDVIIVETSGLSDPSSIREILRPYEQDGSIRFRGTICMVDAVRIEKVFSSARACKKQLAISDLVLINKADLASEEQLRRAGELARLYCPHATILETSYGEIPKEILFGLSSAQRDVEIDNRPDLTLQKHTVYLSPAFASAQLMHFLRMFAEDTYRIKGIVRLEDGAMLVDCVGTTLSVAPSEVKPPADNALTVLAGEGMPLRKSLKAAVSHYDGFVSLDSPLNPGSEDADAG
ncbi:MAG: GTP-binding protein [Bacillota bacterium]